MYADELFAVFVIIIVAVGVVWFTIWAVNDSEKQDRQMRQDFNNCLKAGKEWVFKYDTGLDGFCVTKK